MAQVIHIYPTRPPAPRQPCIPAELMNTPRRHQSWCYWNACQRARRGNTIALHCLHDILRARPTERLACAAGGVLASLGYGYAAFDGEGPAA